MSDWFPPPPYPLFPGYMGETFGFFAAKISHAYYPAPFMAGTTPRILRAFLRRDRDIARMEGCSDVKWEKLPEVWTPDECGVVRVAIAGMIRVRGSEHAMRAAALSTVLFEGEAWSIVPGVLEDWGSWGAYTRPAEPPLVH